MPLTLTYPIPGTPGSVIMTTARWKVTDSVVQVNYLRDLAHKVVEVHADGLELRYIMERFRYLPIPVTVNKGILDVILKPYDTTLGGKPDSARWFGDIAKFIVANL